MKLVNLSESNIDYSKSFEYLYNKTEKWISEIDFIEIEQDFLKELLSEHIIGLCSTENFKNAKLFLMGIEHEKMLGKKLKASIKEHKMNLGLLLEDMYLKREDAIRENHELLKNEVVNFIDNFKYIKKEVFELILQIMKLEKKEKLLANR